MPYHGEMQFLWISLFLAVPAHSAPKNHFLVEINGKPAAVYSESLEKSKKPRSLTLHQEWTGIGANPINMTMRAVALDDLYLTPVSFETHARSRDGKNESKLFVRVKKNGKFKDLAYRFERIKPVREQPKEKQFIMPPDPLFFSFLPRYLAKIEPGLYVLKAVMEDNQDAKMETRPLRINRMAEKKAIHGTTCERSSIDFNGSVGDWWVSKEGVLCEGGFPELKNSIRAISAEEATKLTK